MLKLKDSTIDLLLWLIMHCIWLQDFNFRHHTASTKLLAVGYNSVRAGDLTTGTSVMVDIGMISIFDDSPGKLQDS